MAGVNKATKYVASNTMTSGEWQPSVFLSGDIAEEVTPNGVIIVSYERVGAITTES